MFSLPRISILVIVLALFPCKQVKEVIAEGSLELQGLRLEADLILHIRARNKTWKFIIVRKSGFLTVEVVFTRHCKHDLVRRLSGGFSASELISFVVIVGT